MSSSPQEQTSFPFMSPSPQNSQNQSLFQKLLTAKTEKSFSPEMQQENLTTSPSSIHSHEGTKASLEEESEINTNIHSKKPIFTITRQNKLLKRYI